MADHLDVAARLADGRPAAEHTQSYVWAAHLVGYQHPDLTRHEAQVLDGYEEQNGLDLRVLDGDCAALWAAVSAAEEQAHLQRAQLADLSTAWGGAGADSAAQFLRRHCDSADIVTAGIRAAAEACAGLRDTLWQLVDAKITAACAIDDRTVMQRPVWLAAARTVTAGDRSSAEDVVAQQITPYVDNDIRTDWLTAVRATHTAVAASYTAALDAMAPAPVCFEIPGAWGPGCQPPRGVPTVPAPLAPAPAPAQFRSQPEPTDALALDPPLAPIADTGFPTGAGVPGDLGLGRAFSGGMGPGLGDPLFDEDAFDDEPLDDEPLDDEPPDEPPADDAPPDDAPPDDEADATGPGTDADSPAETAGSVPAELSGPPPVATPAVEPAVEPVTPCETAAEELPQVGQ